MGPRTVKLTAKRDSHARSLVQLFANTVTYEETNDLTNAQFPSDENWELRIEHWPGTCLQIFSGIRYRKSLLPFLKTRTSSQFPQYIRTELEYASVHLNEKTTAVKAVRQGAHAEARGSSTFDRIDKRSRAAV